MADIQDESLDSASGNTDIPPDAADWFSIVNQEHLKASRLDVDVPVFSLKEVESPPAIREITCVDVSSDEIELCDENQVQSGEDSLPVKKRLKAQRSRNRASQCDENVPLADVFPITHALCYLHITSKETKRPMYKLNPELPKQHKSKKSPRSTPPPISGVVEQPKKAAHRRKRNRRNKKDDETTEDREDDNIVPVKQGHTAPKEALPKPEKKTAQQKRVEKSREKRRTANSHTSSMSDQHVTDTDDKQQQQQKQLEKQLENEKQLQLKMSMLERDFIYPLKKTNTSHPQARFYCRLCGQHLQDVGRCNRHLRDNRHIRLKRLRTGDLVFESLPRPSPAHEAALTGLLERVVEEEGLSDADITERQEITDELRVVLKDLVPDADANLYGSSRSGLGLKSSDVNIDIKAAKPSAALKALYSTLKEDNSDRFSAVKSDFSAHVPCVHFIRKKVHVTAGVTTGCEFGASSLTTELLRTYSKIDPRMKQLAVPLRYWAKLCRIDQQEQGTLPSYVFSLMTIYFLQQCNPPVLPVLHEVGGASERKGGCSDNYYFNDLDNLSSHWECENTDSLGQLWLKMCRYYVLEYDNKETVVCIRQKDLLRRAEKKWTKRIPIEDPFMRRRNVTRSLSHSSVFEYIYDRQRALYQYFAIPRTSLGHILKPRDFERMEEVLAQTMKTDQLSADGASVQDPANTSFTFGKGADFKFDFAMRSEEKVESKSSSVKENSADSSEVHTTSEFAQKLTDEAIKQAVQTVTHSDEPEKLSQLIGSPEPSSADVIQDGVSSPANLLGCNDLLSLATTIVEQVITDAVRIVSSSSDEEKEPKPHAARTSTSEEKENTPTPKETQGSGAAPVTQGKKVQLWDQAEVAKLKQEDYEYRFDAASLTDKTGPSLWCLSCQKQGHLKQSCPDEVLPPLKALPPLTPRYMLVLNAILNKVPSDFEPSAEEYGAREFLRDMVEKHCRQIYPSAQLSLFGSSCNGFSFSHSDLDICLVFDDDPDGDDIDHKEVIEHLYKHLRKHSSLRNIIAITNAKVPIVKFIHKYSKLEGDISLYNTLAVHNTRMLELYTRLDDRVRALGYTMKVFAKLCDICDASKGSLSSYAYILMVIYFLQQRKPPVVPVLQELHKGEKPELIVDGWNAWYQYDPKEIKRLWTSRNKESLAELWIGLLRFYTEQFNFRDFVVSIRQHEPLTRFEKLWNGKTIAIEDPFDLGHNLGGGLSSKMNTFIMKAFHNGRSHFGMSLDTVPPHYQTLEDYLFDPKILTHGPPPADRNCRICKRIGHWAKDCPKNPDNRDAEIEVTKVKDTRNVKVKESNVKAKDRKQQQASQQEHTSKNGTVVETKSSQRKRSLQNKTENAPKKQQQPQTAKPNQRAEKKQNPVAKAENQPSQPKTRQPAKSKSSANVNNKQRAQQNKASAPNGHHKMVFYNSTHAPQRSHANTSATQHKHSSAKQSSSQHVLGPQLPAQLPINASGGQQQQHQAKPLMSLHTSHSATLHTAPHSGRMHTAHNAAAPGFHTAHGGNMRGGYDNNQMRAPFTQRHQAAAAQNAQYANPVQQLLRAGGGAGQSMPAMPGGQFQYTPQQDRIISFARSSTQELTWQQALFQQQLSGSGNKAKRARNAHQTPAFPGQSTEEQQFPNLEIKVANDSLTWQQQQLQQQQAVRRRRKSYRGNKSGGAMSAASLN